VIVDYVVGVSLFNLRVVSASLMQNPDTVCVGEENQTSPVVTSDRGNTGEFAGDFGVLGI
jgi:hypothetical protein